MAFITSSGLLSSTNDIFDRITGTSVNDTVVYSSATSSVNVSLSIVGTQNTGGSGFDELISIENITGSNFNDNFEGNAANNVFNGGTGIDTVTYGNATGSVVISLSLPGSQFNGGSGSDTLISIENLIGSMFSDTITGNLTNNFLSGGSGNDTFFGTAGSDVIEGGVGTDTANYNSLTNVVTLSAFGVLNKGGFGTDTLIGVESIVGSSLLGDTVNLSGASVAPATGTVANLTSGVVTVSGTTPLPLNFTVSQFENVIGSGFADTITGNISNNSLSGGGGNDIFFGSAGNDTINGGLANDTANYNSLTTVVTLSAFGVLNKGGFGTDTLIGVESIVGSSLLGDTVNLSGASVAPATGTVANLTSGVVTVSGTTPLPLNFTVSQFENVIGSGFADTITGNISNNSLSGGGGNDTISGGNGADTITGGAGKDQLTGDDGNDRFIFSNLADSLLANFDIITDYSLGDILDRPGLAGTTLNSSSGIASGSTAAQVGSFLNSFIFTSNTSLAFSAIGSSGTFIAFNDTIAGFNALTDSILWLPSYLVNSTNTVTIV